MTTIGILNVAFGALFSLVFLMMILGAWFMAAAGSAIGGEDGAAAGARGGFLMYVGITAFAVNLMLFMGGIGVLKLAPWGRTLSIASGGLGVIVYAALLIGSGLMNPYPGMLVYSFVVVGLFFTEKWKNTFCSCESSQPHADLLSTPESQETREAA
ncbi:MAG: hypothetical protein ACYTGF_05820 [Planctomycetota bacterium]|jgi:hypothetical protein